MTTDDLDDFAAMLDSVCIMLSRGQYKPNETSTAMWFQALAMFPLAVVRAALNEHVRTSKFVPTPHEILELIGGNDGRPGAEEAWSLCLRDRDERLTVVWTQEMRTAWMMALPVLERDEIGARMAFRETYNREVEQARRACRQVVWDLSIGQDRSLAAEVIRSAVADGRLAQRSISDEAAALMLPLPRVALPGVAPDDSDVAKAGKAALAAVVERLRNPPSADLAAKVSTASAATASASRVAAYACREGLVLSRSSKRSKRKRPLRGGRP